jgi:hypothetical protein
MGFKDYLLVILIGIILSAGTVAGVYYFCCKPFVLTITQCPEDGDCTTITDTLK